MESDDDYDLFSLPQEPSPSLHHRKLKRLKKAIHVSIDPPVESAEKVASSPPVDSFESQAPESSETKGSEGLEVDNELNSVIDDLLSREDRKKTKRVLDFDVVDEEFDGKMPDQIGGMEENVADLNVERSEKKRVNEEDSSEDKGKKKKRVKSGGDGDGVKPKTSRRREEKERQNYLQQLHVESQRLLRETRDATFKPIPIVQKPISSVLEKIRQRKLEVMKKVRTVSLYDNCSVDEDNGTVKEVITDHDSENVLTEEKEVDKFAEVVQEETTACHVDVESSLDASRANESKEAARQSSHENSPYQMAVDEQSIHAFRAPVDDTQDLFCDSETSEGKDPMFNDDNDSPSEEVLAPSFLTMNLKFDSAPPDDISSDEEDNDTENIDTEPETADKGSSSPKGDPVKAFVDDEAVEEDDSDNDLLRFQENEEDEENEDYEELKDMIATQYDEKQIDIERRNELHQKWLEQQDTTGTDHLLQRLKCGPKLEDTTLLEEEEEEEEEEEDEDEREFCDEAAEDPVKTNIARINSRKAKQMIPHIFSDKNDGYVSSDGEETERRLVKQRLLDKAEEQGVLLSPGKDESSREVFGLIKKLNIVPDAKKKARTSSFFDKMLTGGNNNSSSKSTFLGRGPSHSLPSSHKQGKGKVRSFIFGRDDSNSRSSISMSEDSSDVIPRENPPARNATTKFSSSQSKFSTQSINDTADAVSGASLFEILKRSSMQSNDFNQDTMVGLTQTVFAAFKIPKKLIKIEGRT